MEELKDLELLVKSRYPIIAVKTYEEERVEKALSSIAEVLDIPFYTWTITGGLRREGKDQGVYDTLPAVRALEHIEARQGDGIFLFKDLRHVLQDPKVVRKMQDIAQSLGKGQNAIVFSTPTVELPTEIEKLTAVYTLSLPSDNALHELAGRVIQRLTIEHEIKVDLTPEDRERLIDAMRGLTMFEAEKVLTQAILSDLMLDRKDLEAIAKTKKELLEKDGLLEYMPPGTSLDDIGGLEKLKLWLEKRKKAFTPEAAKFGIEPPKGILVLGVQGCGKSITAKAVAKDWGLPLLKMEPGRLYEKFVGESEKNLERALQLAERMAPCVMLIDEIEKGFSSVSSGDADGGLSQRIFGRLLGWLQDRQAPVFIVATCNDLSKLPPEIMRKGRFDDIFFVDLPNAKDRADIFALHLKARGRDAAAFDSAALAAAADGFSGAEIEQSIVSALYNAFSQGCELRTEHILEEIRATNPLSVTRAEDIAKLRAWAHGRTQMAN